METVIFLAQIWGFSMVLVALSLLVRQDFIGTLLQTAQNEAALFFSGVVRLVLGLAMVMSYNSWDWSSWEIIITLLGWLMLLSGLAILYIPSAVLKVINNVQEKGLLPILLTGAAILGCILIYFSFA